MKFSYTKMDACCTELQKAVNNIKEILNDINMIRNQLQKDNCWSGKASNFYLDKLSALTNQFEDMKYELDNTVLYLKSVIEGYSAVDRNIISDMKNVININW